MMIWQLNTCIVCFLPLISYLCESLSSSSITLADIKISGETSTVKEIGTSCFLKWKVVCLMVNNIKCFFRHSFTIFWMKQFFWSSLFVGLLESWERGAKKCQGKKWSKIGRRQGFCQLNGEIANAKSSIALTNNLIS